MINELYNQLAQVDPNTVNAVKSAAISLVPLSILTLYAFMKFRNKKHSQEDEGQGAKFKGFERLEDRLGGRSKWANTRIPNLPPEEVKDLDDKQAAVHGYSAIQPGSAEERDIALAFKGYKIDDYGNFFNDVAKVMQTNLRTVPLSKNRNTTYSSDDISMFWSNLMNLSHVLAKDWNRLKNSYGIPIKTAEPEEQSTSLTYSSEEGADEDLPVIPLESFDLKGRQIAYALVVMRQNDELKKYHPLIDNFLAGYKEYKRGLIPRDAPISVSSSENW